MQSSSTSTAVSAEEIDENVTEELPSTHTETEDTDISPPISTSSSNTPAKKRKSEKSEEKKSKEVSRADLIAKVTEIQSSTSSAITQLLTKRDEADLFGELIAAQLRRFKSEENRMAAQLEVQQVITERLREDAATAGQEVVYMLTPDNNVVQVSGSGQ